MRTPYDLADYPRTQGFIDKCEDILFWNLKGTVSASAERFVESVHKQMIKYPERFPTEKQAAVLEKIHEEAMDEMFREGWYALYTLPLRHGDTLATNTADAVVIPDGDRGTNLRIHSQLGSCSN